MWWAIGEIVEELFAAGYSIQQLDRNGLGLIHPLTWQIVTLPVGQGDWLPDELVRPKLQHVGIDLDSLQITPSVGKPPEGLWGLQALPN